MKKSILIFMGIFACAALQAQECTPDQEVPDSVVVAPLPYNAETRPEGGIQDTACVGSYYETVFTFNIPTTYSISGTEVGLLSVQIEPEGSINGLPASMDYVCNPPNCVFEADSVGCLVIFGEPAEGEEGDVEIDINVTINTVLGINPQINLPGDLETGSQYFIPVRAADSPECSGVSSAQESFAAQFELHNAPNPFSGITQVLIGTERGGDYEFVVTDLLGKIVHRQPVSLFPGENTIEFNGSSLPEGMYLYAITDGLQAASGKMIINR